MAIVREVALWFPGDRRSGCAERSVINGTALIKSLQADQK